ncbi:WxL domain-containing protein [Holzapfeliella sp. He02]|uniref:WxL domain-containing protein n=1 Tax=Holzapfeliella saturejae TaxID=3082953 RepID=A0ABU8SE79_9LACO
MKNLNKILGTTIALLSTTTLLGTTTVKAANHSAGSQQTDATLTFKTKDKTQPNRPVDPTNPSQPGGTPPNTGDPNNNGTNSGGPLSIDYAPNFDFGIGEVISESKTYNLKDAKYSDGQTRNHNPFVQVSDNRGTSEGWSLDASISNFTNSQGNTTQNLEGAQVSLQTSDNDKAIGGHGTTSDAPDAKSEPIVLSNSPQTLINAKENTGRGAWIQRYDPSKISLFVPGGSALSDTVYTAKITWTLSASPVN